MAENFEARPLVYDFIIVDECSMIDAKLFSLLLSSIPSGTSHLNGRSRSAPPVEAGFVFPEFFSINELPQIRLNQSMRSDRRGILQLAKHIKQNEIDAVFSLLANPDFPDVKLVPLPKQPPIPTSIASHFLPLFAKATSDRPFVMTTLKQIRKPLLKLPSSSPKMTTNLI